MKLNPEKALEQKVPMRKQSQTGAVLDKRKCVPM